MIKQIYINGFPLSLDGARHITAVSGLTSPTIDLPTYNRGGRDGLVLGNPFYRSRVFTIELVILANSPEMLLQQKDRVITELRLKGSDESKYKLVEFVIAGGSRRSVRAITNKIDGKLTPESSFAMTTVTIQMIAERWYLSGTEHTLDLTTPNFGGMAVPMGVPMDMSVGGSDTKNNQVFNYGNTDSLPKFHLSGPFESADIYNYTAGQHLTITTPVNANETLDLDCFDHTAIKNHVSNVRGSIDGDWIILVPGDNEILFSAAATQLGNKAVITWDDAYIGI